MRLFTCDEALENSEHLKVSPTSRKYNAGVLWIYFSNLGHFYFVDLRWSTAIICQGNVELKKKGEIDDEARLSS